MRRYLLLLGVMLWLGFPLAQAEAVTLEDPAQRPPGRVEMPDKSQENDCDCCQKCKAATKPADAEEESGGTKKKTGCEECCERCGRPQPGAPRDTPPDIIEKPK